MTFPFFSSLRARLILLVLMGAIPLLILLIYSGLELRKQAADSIQGHAKHVLMMVANRQESLVQETRQVLSILAQVSQIRNQERGSCSSFLKKILEDDNIFANLGVISPNGDILCSAIPMKERINVSDRSYFQRTLKSRDFAIGDYQIGRITNTAVLVFSYPVFNDKKQIKAVLFAALPLTWLKQEASAWLPPGSVVDVIDHTAHTLLAQYPEPTALIGTSIEKTALVEAMHASGGTGSAEITDLDGINRLHTFSLLQNLPDGKKIYVSLGIPATVVYAEANAIMARNLAILIFVASLALLLAWYGSNILVLRQVTGLLAGTRRLASGDLGARVKVPNNRNEISELSREFNQMADALEQRDSKATHAEYLLRKSEQHLEHLIETVPDIIYTATALKNFGATFVSPAVTRILGFAPEELVNDPDGWAAAIHDEDRERVFTQLQSALDNAKDDFRVEYRVRHKNEKRFLWFKDRAHIDRDATGHATAIYGVMTDITEQKQAESLSAQMGRILENSWNEIYVYDAASLHFIDVSSGACQNLGYSLEEMKRLTPLDLTPDLTPQQFEALSGPLRRGEKPHATFETRQQRKDGSRYPVEVRLQLSSAETQPVFISIIQDISERKHYIAELEHKAMYDTLTDLPNRSLFQDRLKHALEAARRDPSPLAVFLIDVVRLREVNDILGHSAGDLVLQEVSNRLKQTIRESDTVARMGGDEFAIALPTVSIEHASVVAGKIQKQMEQPIVIEDVSLEIEAAIGIALYPEHGDEPAMLLQQADIAMHVAKNEAKGFSIYNPEDNPYSLRRLRLIGELRKAIEQKKLVLYYQPKIDLMSGQVVSVEALARWPHPVEGMVPPGDFIPMVEQSGLIRPFTLWVLEEAIAQLKTWSEMDVDLSIAVNLSTRNLLDSELPGNITKLLKTYNVRPEHISLEVTESAVMSQPETALKVLTQLDEMGLKLSIDDFGTGYSSLAYLKKLPVHELKIDQSFVFGLTSNDDDAVIVHSTIELARNMGLYVVAEGVEDQDTLDTLTKLKCDICQGYHISRPLPSEELEAWLSTSSWGFRKDRN